MKRSPLKRRSPLRQEPMRRSPIKRKSALKTRTRLRARPQRRARADEPLADWCEARTPACQGRPDVRHHVLPRSAGGGDEAANTLDVCTPCHMHIHAYPHESYEAGWLRRRTA